MKSTDRSSLPLVAIAMLAGTLALFSGVLAVKAARDDSGRGDSPQKHLPAVTPLPTISVDPFLMPAPAPDDLEVTRAVNRGLAFLVSIQKEDGSWHGDVGLKLGMGFGAYQREAVDVPHVGVTALCCMALVAGGHTPEKGEYASNVREGLRYLIRCVDTFGQVKDYGSRMYSHAFAAMFMAEIYGMTKDHELRKALRAVTEFIVKNQVSADANFGGWRYNPGQQDADMSITVCQLQALRAASNVGIEVKEDVIQAARDYITQNYESADGSFYYQPDARGSRHTFALTAAGIVSLQSTGQYDTYKDRFGRTIDFARSLRYLFQERPDSHPNVQLRTVCDFGFWYGHYYAAQAFHQYTHVNPKMWKEWNDLNRRHFLRWQRPNGAWLDEIGTFDEGKNAYATAMACLILSIPNNYLPIFQH